MENLKLFLESFIGLPHCTCWVERREDGEIITSDLAACAFTINAHKAAIERATERLSEITKNS